MNPCHGAASLLDRQQGEISFRALIFTMLSPLEYSWPQAFAMLPNTCTAYRTFLIIYRVYLHPLARFPGPKLAAASLRYEFYFDVIKRGRFAWEIKQVHEVYGEFPRPDA